MKPYERHGMCYEPEYIVWASIVKRCYDSGCEAYPGYGGRGILMSDEWRNNFSSFMADMGCRPEGATIERRDVNKGYEPDNCYWELDRGIQAFNTRLHGNNKSGKAGVMWDSQRDMWQAFIYKDKKKYFLGRFSDLGEAILARKAGELLHYGFYKAA